MPQSLVTLWRRWKIVAEKIGHFQARVVLAVLYFVVVAPFALGVRFFLDPLRIRKQAAGSNWREFSRQTLTLEDARKQF